jgi:hypothetical protein
MRRFQFFALLLVFTVTTNSGVFAAASNLVPIMDTVTSIFDKGVVGVWDYEVEGTEDAYRKGVLFVRMEKGMPVVEVHLGNGVLTGQDVKIVGDTLNFIVNLDGVERVVIVLNAKDDKILGEASSAQGNFAISGTRKLPPQ